MSWPGHGDDGEGEDEEDDDTDETTTLAQYECVTKAKMAAEQKKRDLIDTVQGMTWPGHGDDGEEEDEEDDDGSQ